LQETTAGVERIAAGYEHQCDAARKLAETFFDAE